MVFYESRTASFLKKVLNSKGSKIFNSASALLLVYNEFKENKLLHIEEEAMNQTELSLHEKICQSMIVQANPDKHKKQFGSIKNFLSEYPVGGIFVGGEVIREAKDDRERIMEIISEYRENSRYPLLVAADGENGIGGAVKGFTVLPPEMAVGASGDERLAYEFGRVCALEAASIGINQTFAPVCDLNINRLNLITGTRSLGDDPDRAIPLLRQIIRGFQENGLLATGKHFPGDGIDYRNQHIVTSCNSLSREEWLNKSGAMFRAAIEADIASIMVGHISLPAYQTDAVKGHYPPATLSKDLITGLLKGELGFRGTVITDALDMGGFVRWYDDRDVSEVNTYACGSDMLLWPHLRTIAAIEEAVRQGRIPMERVEDAVSRVIRLKSRIKPVKPGIHEEYTRLAEETAKELAVKGTCLINNELNLIPLKKDRIKKVRLVGITPDDSRFAKTALLAEEFRRRGADVSIVRNWDNYLKDFHTEVDRDYDLIVYCMLNPHNMPTHLFLKDNVSAHSALSFDRDKTVIVSFGSPYFYKDFFETAETFVNSYYCDICMKTFVEGLYGECEFTGTPPVVL